MRNWLIRSTRMLLQSNFYSTMLYISFCFLSAFFISSAFIQKKKKGQTNCYPLIYHTPPFLSWGYPVCIKDNAYFCRGGGHTLVRTNYAHVTCLVYGKIFRFAALLGIVLNL